jgi:hypothetical protein
MNLEDAETVLSRMTEQDEMLVESGKDRREVFARELRAEADFVEVVSAVEHAYDAVVDKFSFDIQGRERERNGRGRTARTSAPLPCPCPDTSPSTTYSGSSTVVPVR